MSDHIRAETIYQAVTSMRQVAPTLEDTLDKLRELDPPGPVFNFVDGLVTLLTAVCVIYCLFLFVGVGKLLSGIARDVNRDFQKACRGSLGCAVENC